MNKPSLSHKLRRVVKRLHPTATQAQNKMRGATGSHEKLAHKELGSMLISPGRALTGIYLTWSIISTMKYTNVV